MIPVVMTGQEIYAAEWRGIVPMRSTRADVVRIFGECSGNETHCKFSLDNEDILIVFSGAECKDVAPDSVVYLRRQLATSSTFTAMKLDKRRFQSFDPSIPRNTSYRGFIDEETGLLVKTFDGAIYEIFNIPTREDRRACPHQYRKPRELLAVSWPHFLTVKLDCPSTAPVAGTKVPIVASSPEGLLILWTWDIRVGRIISGLGTRKIVVDTTGLQGQTVTVTVEGNAGLSLKGTEQCKFNVISPAGN